MIEWLSENMSTIIISLVLFGIVLSIVYKIIKDKKQGKSSCGCNCAHCAMAENCRK